MDLQQIVDAQQEFRRGWWRCELFLQHIEVLQRDEVYLGV
jgi:hypothetical protein